MYINHCWYFDLKFWYIFYLVETLFLNKIKNYYCRVSFHYNQSLPYRMSCKLAWNITWHLCKFQNLYTYYMYYTAEKNTKNYYLYNLLRNTSIVVLCQQWSFPLKLPVTFTSNLVCSILVTVLPQITHIIPFGPF